MMLPDPDPPAHWRTCSYADGMELWSEALESAELSPSQRQMLRHRVMNASCRLKASVVRLGRVYRSMKIIVTAGALLVPSLSALNMGQPSVDGVFWLIWCCGLGTSFCNAFVSLFGVDRKYFVQKEQLSRLESEAWLFVGCAGRYRTDGTRPHAQHLAPFVERVEFILQKASREMPHPEAPPRGGAPSEASDRPRTPRTPRVITLDDGTPSGG